jgi:pimeloyl-ACP methyl ester carboxylesterase
MKMNQLSRIYSVVAASVGYGMSILYPVSAFSQDNRFDQGVKNIVLVHRAWANGSSWSKVIPLSAEKGLHVTAVALPLTSLGDDVAATERALALETGSVLLVGHSYGGAVITEAANQANVAGLLYVAAYAPDNGESALSLATANPTPVGGELRADPSTQYFKLSEKGIFDDFAQDLPPWRP